MDIEALRVAAHDAPMNKVFTDHRGNKSLGSHSRAWADTADRFAVALADAMLSERAK